MPTIEASRPSVCGEDHIIFALASFEVLQTVKVGTAAQRGPCIDLYVQWSEGG